MCPFPFTLSQFAFKLPVILKAAGTPLSFNYPSDRISLWAGQQVAPSGSEAVKSRTQKCNCSACARTKDADVRGVGRMGRWGIRKREGAAKDVRGFTINRHTSSVWLLLLPWMPLAFQTRSDWGDGGHFSDWTLEWTFVVESWPYPFAPSDPPQYTSTHTQLCVKVDQWSLLCGVSCSKTMPNDEDDNVSICCQAKCVCPPLLSCQAPLYPLSVWLCESVCAQEEVLCAVGETNQSFNCSGSCSCYCYSFSCVLDPYGWHSWGIPFGSSDLSASCQLLCVCLLFCYLFVCLSAWLGLAWHSFECFRNLCENCFLSDLPPHKTFQCLRFCGLCIL